MYMKVLVIFAIRSKVDVVFEELCKLIPSHYTESIFFLYILYFHYPLAETLTETYILSFS